MFRNAAILLVCAIGGVAHAEDVSIHEQVFARHSAVSTVNYGVRDVKLIRDTGQSVSLPQEMNDCPVMMNFIFTACASASVCGKVHSVSISIDPEQDTPERLRKYAKQFSGGPTRQQHTERSAASSDDLAAIAVE